MHISIVSNVTELRQAFAEARAMGLRWAALSSTGLPEGQWRVTFIPETAFGKADTS